MTQLALVDTLKLYELVEHCVEVDHMQAPTLPQDMVDLASERLVAVLHLHRSWRLGIELLIVLLLVVALHIEGRTPLPLLHLRNREDVLAMEADLLI